MRGLGRLFDLSVGFVPVDTQTGANTGKRISMRYYEALTIVVFKAAGTANDDPVLTLQEHNASSGGTSQNLAALTVYYQKQAATLAGTETWTEVTQAAAATITFNSTSAESQAIYAIPVNATALSDGFTHLSASIADTGSAGAQLGSILYIAHDLHVQRKPANLPAPLS